MFIHIPKMGIKHLNRFLLDNCSKKSIKKIHLSQFANKTIVVDTSIYLYRFMTEGLLLENMYLLISIFHQYKIKPIFVFDGKPPIEKNELLLQRRQDKKTAERTFMELQSELDSGQELDDDTKHRMAAKMDLLKRRFIRIRETDIKRVKDLMDAYNVIYFDAPGEADQLCAYFVKSGQAWACMSDDMDMFLYGCGHVLRQLSLMNHTIMMYDFDSILLDLQMTRQDFCEIMVLSGTDYNIQEKTSLTETIRWYYEYIHYKNKVTEVTYLRFYVWLVKNTLYIKDFRSLLETYQIFQLEHYAELGKWANAELVPKPIDLSRLQSIMMSEGFVFG